SPGLWSPNRHCRLIQTKDDWIAVSLARQDDIDLLPAWIGTEFDAEPWEALITTAAQRTAKDMVETAIGLHLPVALAGESDPLDPPRSEEHTSELQSRENLVCRLLLEKKK